MLGRRAACIESHCGDTIEFGLLSGVFLGLLTLLIALVEHLDLLELFKGLAQRGLCVIELTRNSSVECLDSRGATSRP